MSLGTLEPVAVGVVAALAVLGAVGVRALLRYVGARGGMAWDGHGEPDDEVVEF